MVQTGKIIAILIFTISTFFSYGQSKREVMNMELEAKENFQNFEFHKALQLYLKLDRYEPNNPNYMYFIGVCYLDLYDSEKALPYLIECAKRTNAGLPNSLNYYLAKTYHLEHHFDGAINYYKKYLAEFPNLDKHEEVKKEIEREIETCLYAKQLFETPLDITIKNLGAPINSTFPEYGAIFSADGETVIFTSDRPNTTGGHVYQLDGTFYEDIYISHKENGVWSEPKSISNKINTWHHDAAVALSHDGHQLLFYRYSHNSVLHTSGDLYLSEFKNGEWGEPEHLPHPINSKSWESSACFSPNDNEIFFTSDRKGGYGGTDIYKSQKLPDGSWTEPENLGPNVNTPYNEDSPYLHPNKYTLYFSSNGHQSMGGYDIFLSELHDNEWSKPKNLGYPINTSGDDLYFTISTDGKTIYFTDHRHDSFGDKDIYSAQISNKEANIMIVKGSIKDSLNKTPVEAIIKVRKSNNPEIESVFYSNSITGKYVLLMNEGIDYTISIEAEGYNTLNKTYKTSDLKGYIEKIEDIKLIPLEIATGE